jgi:tRNA nucleotidyltransferase (CCA-adding enzyme)
MVKHAKSVTALTQRGVSGTARKELDKLLMSENPQTGLAVLRDTDALAHFLPELEPMLGFDQESKYHDMTCDEHTFEVVSRVATAGGTIEARLAALFHDSGKPEVAFRGKDGRLHYYGAPENDNTDHAVAGSSIALRTLTRLNYPIAITGRVSRLVLEHMVPEANKPTAVKARRMRQRMDDSTISDLLVLRRADMHAKGEFGNTKGLDVLSALIYLNRNSPRSVADLEVNGHDLMALGIEGERIGFTLRALLHDVVAAPGLNRREWLLKMAAKINRKGK